MQIRAVIAICFDLTGRQPFKNYLLLRSTNAIISEFTQEEDDKTLERDKRDGPITRVFCREFT